MKITSKLGKWKQSEVDALIIPMITGEGVPKGLPKFAEQLISDAIARKEFSGKAREINHFLVPTVGKKGLRHLIFIGIGKANDIQSTDFGEVFGRAIRLAQAKKASTVGFWYRDVLEEQIESVRHLAEIIAEYGQMARYEFSEYFKKKKPQVKQLTVYIENKAEQKAIAQGLKIGSTIGKIVNDSRDLCNRPSNKLTPKDVSLFAKDAGKTDTKLQVKILGEKQMEKLGMGALLGVSQGSLQEGQFVIAEYWGAAKKDAPYVVIGKGVTFDTGGISLKPSSSMDEMKFDMCGGAAALGVVRAISALNLPINVVALVPAAENMPGQNAYKPGDVLVAKDGTTIEVLNTDAEGRLLLADALVYARDYKPKAVVDLATLTGASAVALHDAAAGMFTDDDELSAALDQGGKAAGDLVWRMPMPARYSDYVKSKVADIQNIGSTRFGGAITAAIFLKHFVAKKYPWAHLDIAGLAWSSGGRKHLTPGATGAGIRACVEWLRAESK